MTIASEQIGEAICNFLVQKERAEPLGFILSPDVSEHPYRLRRRGDIGRSWSFGTIQEVSAFLDGYALSGEEAKA